MIYDGTGAEPYVGAVAIQEDRIVQVVKGAVPAGITENAEIIDAAGKNVTPGLIDIHRHCDIKPFYGTDYGRVLLAQGITTTVVGNCGFSMTPVPQDPTAAKEMQDYAEPVVGPAYEGIHTFPEYMQALETKKLPVNTASMIGAGTVKIAVKGFSDTAYTEPEMERAQQYIQEALESGAVGVSAGVMYLPECYSTTDEYAALLAPMRKYKVPLCVHIRGEGDSLTESIREVIEIGRKVGCPVEISHFKSCGLANWGKEIHKAIALIEEARSKGQDVTCDFYPYVGGSTTLVTMVPPAFVKGDMKKALERLGTPEGVQEFCKSLEKSYPDWDNYAVSLGWDRILISGVTKEENQKWVGMTVREAAIACGLEDGEYVARLLHEEDGKVAIISMSMSQEDVDTVARLPYSSVISDSIYADTDTPHPRMYGAFPKMIREYVQERKILTMEEAIRKMTDQPARRMGLEGRGRIQEGYYADLLIWKELKDLASWENPTQLAVGVEKCYINGKPAWLQGTMVNDNCGRIIKRRILI